MAGTRSVRSRLRRRRDRRGRGVRGLLFPATLPAARSRSERFDAIVLGALEPIDERWHADLDRLDVAVDEVPEVTDCDPTTVTWGSDVVEDGNIPLARLIPAGVDRAGLPTRARIVLYRRPLETRAPDGVDLSDLVHEVLVEQVANYLGLDPDVIDGPEEAG
ncbi:MAG: metallopeptidase family protein [Pseudonocardiales bacterium]|nr:metallopeptidase family protein [Pseudonocardiales bacterium]MBV9031042.1 metallopeptidase family protein [Pseudonocardiales bacterium]MBW0009334.1 metallopeptidase family protein [Pseudonocardiales bacterium]